MDDQLEGAQLLQKLFTCCLIANGLSRPFEHDIARKEDAEPDSLEHHFLMYLPSNYVNVDHPMVHSPVVKKARGVVSIMSDSLPKTPGLPGTHYPPHAWPSFVPQHFVKSHCMRAIQPPIYHFNGTPILPVDVEDQLDAESLILCATVPFLNAEEVRLVGYAIDDTPGSPSHPLSPSVVEKDIALSHSDHEDNSSSSEVKTTLRSMPNPTRYEHHTSTRIR
ncbi:14900_t:CDS:2, partial [Acaulospora colombiana]